MAFIFLSALQQLQNLILYYTQYKIMSSIFWKIFSKNLFFCCWWIMAIFTLHQQHNFQSTQCFILQLEKSRDLMYFRKSMTSVSGKYWTVINLFLLSGWMIFTWLPGKNSSMYFLLSRLKCNFATITPPAAISCHKTDIFYILFHQ